MTNKAHESAERMRKAFEHYEVRQRIESGELTGDQMANDMLTVCEAYIAEHPNDEYEPVDPDWLLANGFTGGNDEPDVDVYQRRSGNGGPRVQVAIRFRRGEIFDASLALAWDYDGPPKVGLSYAIDDYPTRGDIRRLCQSLGFDSTVET